MPSSHKKPTSGSEKSRTRKSRDETEDVRPKNKAKIPEDKFAEFKDDPEFQQFLQLQRNVVQKQKSYAWANDVDVGPADDPVSEPEDQEESEEQSEKPVKAKKEFTQSEWTIKLRNLGMKAKKGEVKRWFEPLQVTRVKMPGRIKGIAYVSFRSEEDMRRAMDKHKSLLSGHQVLISVHDKDSDVAPQQPAGKQEPKPYHEIKESVADTGRLYVRNLSYTCTSQDLEDLFSPFGQLTEVYLPIDKNTKRVKGFAFVTFMFPEHAIAAMDALDKSKFQERLIHILSGESKPDNLSHFNNLSAFKQKKELALREDRETSTTWNTLFLGANAAADLMSAKYNVKKSDLIADRETNDSIAVRMALGETQIVSETKNFLLENGINLSAFTDQGMRENPNDMSVRKRSKTVILVKNLMPGKTTSEELEKVFSRFGLVTRVVFPQHGVTAIVQMQEEVEAKKAFTGLLNFKLHHSPIYLEWAPIDVFTDGKVSGTRDDGLLTPFTSGDATEGMNRSPDESAAQTKGPTADQENPGFRLFVKNLNFETTDAGFEQHFASAGQLVSASISRKKGSGLSNGYGFVVYESAKAAEKAVKSLHNSILDAHCLVVQPSHSLSRIPTPASSHVPGSRAGSTASTARTAGEKTDPLTHDLTPDAGVSDADPRLKEGDAQSKTTKLLVRNIPFEASAREVEQVFSAFSGLRSVRLPKKLAGASVSSGGRNSRTAGSSSAGAHRGFGFVEYNSRSEAEKALQALSASTHLYGRRLVLEWAQTADESGDGDDPGQEKGRRVIGSDMKDEDRVAKKFKKANLNSTLRAVSGSTTTTSAGDPMDFERLA